MRLTVAGVELKVTTTASPTDSNPKYINTPNVGSADNLFSVWPSEKFNVKVNIKPDELANNLPAGYIKWTVPGFTIPDNTDDFRFEWSVTGLKVIKIEFPALGMTKKVYVDVPNVGFVSETVAALMLPALVSGSILLYADTAQDYANSHFPAGPRRDAMKHSYWNALCVSDLLVTQSQTLFLTTAHEYTNKWSDKQQAFNSSMDLFNNLVGSTVYYMNIFGLPKKEEILEDLHNKYNNGELRIWARGTPPEPEPNTQGNSEGILINSNGTKIFPVD